MQNITKESFGIVIAYVLPGYFTLVGTPPFIFSQNEVVLCKPNDFASVGSFLSTTLAALSLGMLLSAVRWLTVDTLHWTMGIRPKKIQFHQLKEILEPFLMLVEEHYRYYQFYSNGFIGLGIVLSIRLATGGLSWLQLCLVVGLMVLLFLASRDTLKKYYERTDALFRDDRHSFRLHLP